MKRLIFIFLTTIISINCYSQNCETIPNNFSSFKNAISIVKDTHFSTEESVNTSKSSWIISAKFYSCDKKKGFLLLESKKKDYLFQDVPYSVWEEFKNARSFGKNYNTNIRNRYNLNLR